MSQETFGLRLKRLRARAGLSQSQLARAAGVSFGTLKNWEYDRREPLLSAAVKLARGLGVSVEELAGVAEKPRSKKGK